MLSQVESGIASTKQKKVRLLDLHIAGAITIEEFKERNDSLNDLLKEQESQLAAIHQEQAKAGTQELDIDAIRKELNAQLSFEDGINTAKATLTLPVSGKFIRLRLIENGTFADATVDGKVTVELLPGQSEILVFGSAADEMCHPYMPVLSAPVKVTTLTPTYEIVLADSEDLTAFYPYKTTDKLVNITSAAEKPSFSGLARYTFTVHLEEVPANAVLDLGRVGQTAKFIINGTNAGIRITAPYSCPISYLLQQGENTVTIEVANTLVGKVRDPFSHCMPITPSGLLGPVKLVEY
jgi:hypothetical protein